MLSVEGESIAGQKMSGAAAARLEHFRNIEKDRTEERESRSGSNRTVKGGCEVRRRPDS